MPDAAGAPPKRSALYRLGSVAGQAVATRSFLFLALAFLALATWPGWWQGSDFSLGLSSNLFASVVTTMLTLFGVNVLLSRIERRSTAHRHRAARVELTRSLTWIFNRFHHVAPTVIKAFADPGIREDFPEVLTSFVQADRQKFESLLVEAPWQEVTDGLNEVMERIPHLRVLLAVAVDAIPSEATAHLIRAMGVVEAASSYGPGAIDEQRSKANRFLSALAVRALLGEAFVELTHTFRLLGRLAPES
jgi:hypothetical protein